MSTLVRSLHAAVGARVLCIVMCMTRPSERFRDERGDVPGWVLVTVMTAGLVTALWLVADNQLRAVLTNAMNSVTR